MSDKFEEFAAFREKMNARILEEDNKVLKRFFALDTQAFHDGALPGKTKEIIGLVASMVLRCDDCVTYHLNKCLQSGFTKAQIVEGLGIGLLIGGSITIPHMRRAVDLLDDLCEDGDCAES